jgi:hypothetical protein
MTPFSMLFHNDRFDSAEQDYLDSFQIKVLDFNNPINSNF